MRALFYDTYGTYTFATSDERPTVEDTLAYLRWVAQTKEGMQSLRDLVGSMDLAPKLSEVDDEDVLVMLAEKVVSGAFNASEANALPPPVVEQRKAEPARPQTPPPAVAPPAESTAPPPSHPQAIAFVAAAQSGTIFCELCERLRQARERQEALAEESEPSASSPAESQEEPPAQELAEESEPPAPSPAESEEEPPAQELAEESEPPAPGLAESEEEPPAQDVAEESEPPALSPAESEQESPAEELAEESEPPASSQAESEEEPPAEELAEASESPAPSSERTQAKTFLVAAESGSPFCDV